nr:hypothetical protein [Tanacetum cinerariifolium]
MESSETREYPSFIQTYFDTHTVDSVFLRDEERLLYEEMLRLNDLGHNMLTGFWRDRAETSSQYLSLDACTPPMSMSCLRGFNHGMRSKVAAGLARAGGYNEPCKGEDAGEDEDADGDEDS